MIHHPKGGGGRCEMFQTHHFFRGEFDFNSRTIFISLIFNIIALH